MLTLTRRKGEAIILSFDGLTVALTVVDHRNGEVKLGFAAPQEVTILREELAQPCAELDQLRASMERRAGR